MREELKVERAWTEDGGLTLEVEFSKGGIARFAPIEGYVARSVPAKETNMAGTPPGCTNCGAHLSRSSSCSTCGIVTCLRCATPHLKSHVAEAKRNHQAAVEWLDYLERKLKTQQGLDQQLRKDLLPDYPGGVGNSLHRDITTLESRRASSLAVNDALKRIQQYISCLEKETLR